MSDRERLVIIGGSAACPGAAARAKRIMIKLIFDRPSGMPFDRIVRSIRNYKKGYLVYGVTGAGICKLMGLNRICPFSKS